MATKGMWRIIGRQVRSRRDRSIALGTGILVASVSFSLLTAAASTSQLEVHGTVDAASRPAYDILVRPKGAADAIETQDNLVRDNYLAGTFGGISVAQWQKILKSAQRHGGGTDRKHRLRYSNRDGGASGRAPQRLGSTPAVSRESHLEGCQRPVVVSGRYRLRLLHTRRINSS